MSPLEKFDPDNDGYLPILRNLIRLMGDDPDREGVIDTPIRVMRSYREMFAGYKMDPEQIVKVFNSGTINHAPVIVKGISFFSFCEHHLLPFFGTINIGYLPYDGATRIGLSKLPRLVDVYSKRLQVQERMTEEIGYFLFRSALKPHAVAITSRARHMCVECRGVSREIETVCHNRWMNPELSESPLITIMEHEVQK